MSKIIWTKGQSGENNPNFKHTNEDLRLEALKYSSKIEFKTKASSKYSIAGKRGILNHICAHMKQNLRRTDGEIHQIALQCKTRGEFENRFSSVYQISVNRGILDSVCSHMPIHVEQSGENNSNYRYTDEEIRNNAIKCITRGEFQRKYEYHYNAALRRDLLNEVCSHMPIRMDHSGENNPSYKWTDEDIQKDSL